jgi:hypothetical protein
MSRRQFLWQKYSARNGRNVVSIGHRAVATSVVEAEKDFGDSAKHAADLVLIRLWNNALYDGTKTTLAESHVRLRRHRITVRLTKIGR